MSKKVQNGFVLNDRDIFLLILFRNIILSLLNKLVNN